MPESASLSPYSLHGTAYRDSVKACLLAEEGDGYYDSADAATHAALIEHMTEHAEDIACNDPDQDFSEDDDYWYYKEDDGTIVGVPKNS